MDACTGGAGGTTGGVRGCCCGAGGLPHAMINYTVDHATNKLNSEFASKQKYILAVEEQ